VLRAAQRDAAEAVSLDELARGAVAALCDHVQAHVGLCYRIEANGALAGVMARGSPELLDLYHANSEHDPLIAVKTRLNPELAVTTDLIDRASFVRSRAYRAVFGPAEAEHQLVVRLTPLEYPNPGVTAMVLCRSASRGRFSASDRALIAEAAPALSAAARRADRTRSLTAERDLLAALVARDGVFAVVDLDGRERWLSPEAEAVLGPQRRLPPELSAKLAQLRQLHDGRGAERLPADVTRLVIQGEGRRPRELDACLARDRLVVLYVASSETSGPVSRAAAHYELRPSEARVLEGLLRGRSNAEIARELFVSCETVRTHVHRILQRLRVRSRLEAVAKLRRFAT
jgi:DNA-binding CsgD family transcriptional regulator